jgi:sec-independent protein translocase protein TatA
VRATQQLPWFEPVLAVPSRALARFRRSECVSLSLLCESEIMFGIGYQEMIIVLIVVFILFGHRLPSVMRSLGRGVVEFKQGMAGIEDEPEKVEKKDTHI